LKTDDDLMKAAREGDSSAFAELTERHRGWVTGVLLAYVRDREHAEDLAQETFLRIHANLDRYQGRGGFVAWAKRIAVNLARDFLRKRKNRSWEPLEEAESTVGESAYDPSSLLAMEGLREDLKSAIDALPADQRLTLILCYFGDMSVKEIAWAMQCPVGTARSRLFNALRRVRQRLARLWLLEGELK
jgi:RNA polymerase sigma-70 factor (ECF subfamily)